MKLPLPGKKTYITALAAVLTAWGMFFGNTTGLDDAIRMSFEAMLAMFLRVGVAAKKTLPLLCVSLLLVACNSPGNTNYMPENRPSHHPAAQAGQPPRGTCGFLMQPWGGYP